jgi:5-(aminomethyl)-3-furanmethanol phosphate kinase
MWVVKLGGSLLGTLELKMWLEMLARQSDGRIVIVPGGGVFADLVRSTQADGGYDDAAAHHMALLAMEQYALVLKSLQPDLVMASSELEIAERSWQHRAMVWMPSRMVLANEAIPMNWDVTSDSLAAWLCGKIGADRLVLVKHATNAEQPASVKCLVEDGVLDAAFPEFAARMTCPIHVVGKADHAAFAAIFTAGTIPALAL